MTADQSIPGVPCWIELFTSDTARVAEFYGGLLGWEAESAGEEYGGYVNFSLGGRRVAGCMHNDGSTGVPDTWSVYLASSDVEKVAALAGEHGGGVIVPPMAVMELGSMAVLADAGGAAVGAWQAGTHDGFEVRGEPGAPAWFELHTRSYGESVDFYRDVFGWDVHELSDTPEFRYSTLGPLGGERAGIMDASAHLPEGVPAHWTVYFEVADTDAAVGQVTARGGALLVPAEDTPYGRIAVVADPTGAAFRLMAAT